MDGADGRGIEMLERIVALLFSLATLADRIGARPGLAALDALWAMTHAERVARDYLCGTDLEADFFARDGFVQMDIDMADAAARLAHRFRVLALWLHHMIGQFCVASSFETGSRPKLSAPSRATLRTLRPRRPVSIDTS